MEKGFRKSKILMVGPGRNVRGGVSTVVNDYYRLGMDQMVELKYIASMKDGNKIKKLLVAITAYLKFCFCVDKYDIVHIHMAAQASFSRKALFVKKAHRARKKIVIHQHAADFDDFFFQQSNVRKRMKIKTIFGMADKVVVLSDEWARFFGENVCAENRIFILYNGIILPKYKKTDYSDHKVLFLGRLGERKGSYDILKAIPGILDKVPDAMFYLAGDGDIENHRKIVENKVSKCHIEFLGWIKEEKREKYLKDISTFILPSYHEGMPMSILEAMSYGMATVSTNVGGIPQIIENDINGIRIDAGDVNAITDTLVDLLQNESKKKELGQAAYKRVKEQFNAEKNIEKLRQLYMTLLD
ncbi:MAG: glycosyltransferase family 4 protein [Lachnospiraceae bacterium]|jgi:glycosyltransferase involved in cell wall biosynthesis|nr:glycosyltransferase family 4 protein [Lachnospiraceae bacterium]